MVLPGGDRVFASSAADLVRFPLLWKEETTAATASNTQTPPKMKMTTNIPANIKSNPDGSVDVYFRPAAPGAKRAIGSRQYRGRAGSLYFAYIARSNHGSKKTWRPGNMELPG